MNKLFLCGILAFVTIGSTAHAMNKKPSTPTTKENPWKMSVDERRWKFADSDPELRESGYTECPGKGCRCWSGSAQSFIGHLESCQSPEAKQLRKKFLKTKKD